MGRHRRRTVVVVVAVLIVVGALGATALHRGERLLVIGDSLSWMASKELRGAGSLEGYDVAIEAVAGVTLDEKLDLIQRAVQDGEQRLVIELGTNDVATATGIDDLAVRIDRAVAAVAAVRCVVFVNVGVLTGAVEGARLFNQHLAEAIAGHANLHLYDWAADYAARPDWSADGIHLLPEDDRFYAEGIINAVHSSCR